MAAFYPRMSPSEITNLKSIEAQLQKDPDYLGDACPWDEPTKRYVKDLFTRNTAKEQGAGSFLGKDGDKWARLEQETKNIYEQMKSWGDRIEIESTAEKMSFYRTMTSLLEKIVAINERARGLKKLFEFQDTVLNTMEKELSVDQRARVMARLRASIGQTVEEAPLPELES